MVKIKRNIVNKQINSWANGENIVKKLHYICIKTHLYKINSYSVILREGKIILLAFAGHVSRGNFRLSSTIFTGKLNVSLIGL